MFIQEVLLFLIHNSVFTGPKTNPGFWPGHPNAGTFFPEVTQNAKYLKASVH
jgi:hypothetical protein